MISPAIAPATSAIPNEIKVQAIWIPAWSDNDFAPELVS